LHRKASLLQAFGALYISIPVVALLWLRDDPVYGMATTFWLLAVVWATDTGALFAGRAIGGPKLAPTISPNKTWAGLFGGIASAMLVSLGAALWYGSSAVWPLVIAGGLLAVVAQAGDLLESRVKRYLSVKDSGGMIPGHGGLFDRVDGLLAAAPVLGLAYLVIGGGAFLWR
jgi:phosphatidate cytidylyltransferase